MKDSKLLNGSICFSELVIQMKKGHSAFTKAENGKIYFNVSLWLNEDEPDKFGNHMAIQLNSKKANRDVEGKVYIGNAKLSDKVGGGSPVSKTEAASIVPDHFEDDLPF